jgi:hypothetical protein
MNDQAAIAVVPLVNHTIVFLKSLNVQVVSRKMVTRCHKNRGRSFLEKKVDVIDSERRKLLIRTLKSHQKTTERDVRLAASL